MHGGIDAASVRIAYPRVLPNSHDVSLLPIIAPVTKETGVTPCSLACAVLMLGSDGWCVPSTSFAVNDNEDGLSFKLGGRRILTYLSESRVISPRCPLHIATLAFMLQHSTGQHPCCIEIGRRDVDKAPGTACQCR